MGSRAWTLVGRGSSRGACSVADLVRVESLSRTSNTGEESVVGAGCAGAGVHDTTPASKPPVMGIEQAPSKTVKEKSDRVYLVFKRCCKW